MHTQTLDHAVHPWTQTTRKKQSARVCLCHGMCVCVCVIARADWINVIFALTSTGLSYRALLCENKHIWEEENS